MTFDNDVLCAEEGEEENATETGVLKVESKTAKFEILVSKCGAWWLASER
jgi:hypothetical protein